VTEEQREGVPPYLAIAAALRARIESDELPPGAMLPSITRISQEWGVAKITAAKALKVLRSEGLNPLGAGLGHVCRRARRLRLPLSSHRSFLPGRSGRRVTVAAVFWRPGRIGRPDGGNTPGWQWI